MNNELIRFLTAEIDGIYDSWLVDKEEAKKKISWNLEFNDPKGYLDGLIKRIGQINYEKYKG